MLRLFPAFTLPIVTSENTEVRTNQNPKQRGNFRKDQWRRRERNFILSKGSADAWVGGNGVGERYKKVKDFTVPSDGLKWHFRKFWHRQSKVANSVESTTRTSFFSGMQLIQNASELWLHSHIAAVASLSATCLLQFEQTMPCPWLQWPLATSPGWTADYNTWTKRFSIERNFIH